MDCNLNIINRYQKIFIFFAFEKKMKGGYN